MVKMKNENTPVVHGAVVQDANVRSTLDQFEQLNESDPRYRGDADDIVQLMAAMNDLVPQLQQLGLRAGTGAIPAAQKTGKTGKPGVCDAMTQCRDAELETDQALRAFAAPIPKGGPHSGAILPRNLATPALQNVTGSLPSSSCIAGKDWGAGAAGAAGGADDAVEPVVLTSSDAARDADALAAAALTAPAQRDGREAVAAARTPTGIATAATHAAHSCAAGATQDGWVYRFHSWGAQHAVKVSPAEGLAQSSFAALALHPSSVLVAQRLNAHADLAGRSDQWIFREYGDDTQHHRRHPQQHEHQHQHQHQGRQQQGRQEEDES